MIVEISPYCVEDDIENRISIAGVALRVDDIPPDDLGDAIDEASIEVYEHLGTIYDDTQLAASSVIKRWCADIATYHLCTRRGNPAPAVIQRKYDKAIERLEKYQHGTYQLPDAAPRSMAAPVMSNINQRLMPTPHPRVQVRRSTGKRPTDYVQRMDGSDPAQWGAIDYNI